MRRALELAEGGGGGSARIRWSARSIVRGRGDDRRGVPRRAGRPARRAGGARGLPPPRRGPCRGDDVRDARALRAPGAPAALHRGDPRGGDRPRRGRLRRSLREGLRARARRSSARRASRSLGRDGEEAEAARLLNQPFRKHARTGRPLVTLKMAMSLDGRTSTAAGRLALDLRRGEPRPRPPLARRIRRDRGRHRHGPRRRPAAHRPRRRRRPPAGPRRLRPPARLPLDSQLLATLDQSPVLVVTGPEADPAASSAARGRRRGRRRRRHRRAPSVRARPPRASPPSSSRAAPPSPPPSPRRTRSTRRASSSPRSCSAGGEPPAGALDRRRRRHADRRPASRSGEMFTGLIAGRRHGRGGRGRRRGRDAAHRHRARRPDRRRRLGRRRRHLPDRDRGRRRAASPPRR